MRIHVRPRACPVDRPTGPGGELQRGVCGRARAARCSAHSFPAARMRWPQAVARCSGGAAVPAHGHRLVASSASSFAPRSNRGRLQPAADYRHSNTPITRRSVWPGSRYEHAIYRVAVTKLDFNAL
jgi:hypothetical protein